VTLDTEVAARIDGLIDRGQHLLSHRGFQVKYGSAYWVDTSLIPEVQAWVASTANIISHLAIPGSYFVQETDRITSSDELQKGAPWSAIQKMQGLLTSLKDEAAHGLLKKIEYVVVATAFDSFLDHADDFHRGNKAREAGVLAFRSPCSQRAMLGGSP